MMSISDKQYPGRRIHHCVQSQVSKHYYFFVFSEVQQHFHFPFFKQCGIPSIHQWFFKAQA